MTAPTSHQATENPRAPASAALTTLLLFCPSTTAEPAALANRLALAGIRLVVRPHALAEQGAPSAADVQQLRSQIQEVAPVLVLASSPWPLALSALAATRQAQRPFIYCIDQALGHDAGELERHATVAQGADCVLLGSADQHAALVGQGVAPEKLRLAADVQAQATAVLEFLRVG